MMLLTPLAMMRCLPLMSRGYIMCEARIIAEGSIICPTGQTSFKNPSFASAKEGFLLVESSGLEPLTFRV